MPRYHVEATLPVVLDDRLRPTSVLAPKRLATRCDPEVEALVERATRRMLARKGSRMDPAGVLESVRLSRSSWFGLVSRQVRAPVALVSWRRDWKAGVLRWHFRWEVDTGDEAVTEEAMVDAVRASLAGALTDGWGESVEQAARFGPLVATDDEGERPHVATPAEVRDRGLVQSDQGRYAALLTLRGATVRLIYKYVGK